MPTTCLSCFSARGRRETLVPKSEMSPCSTTAPVISFEEYSDALSEPSDDSDGTLDLYRSRLSYVRELCIDNSFIFDHSDCGVELSYKPRGDDPLIARGRLTVEDFTFENFQYISDLILDTSKRHLWDTDLYEIETLSQKKISTTESIVKVYASFKGKLGFQGREFFWNIYTRVTDNEIVHVTMPGDDDGINRHSGRFVRGRTLLGGLCISRKFDNVVEMVLVNQTDVFGTSSKRLVPDWIIDSVMKKSPMKLVAIKNFITQHTSANTSI